MYIPCKQGEKKAERNPESGSSLAQPEGFEGLHIPSGSYSDIWGVYVLYIYIYTEYIGLYGAL